jgi:hypothetical protein
VRIPQVIQWYGRSLRQHTTAAGTGIKPTAHPNMRASNKRNNAAIRESLLVLRNKYRGSTEYLDEIEAESKQKNICKRRLLNSGNYIM